jgi:hypothetical protein
MLRVLTFLTLTPFFVIGFLVLMAAHTLPPHASATVNQPPVNFQLVYTQAEQGDVAAQSGLAGCTFAARA